MAGFDARAVIIGAGPCGVSTAAHLRSCGVDFRIFGSPMNRERTQMPGGHPQVRGLCFQFGGSDRAPHSRAVL
jgi:cation diffusion facilitator CzcD-associated flavoprotein CzcO